MKVVAMYEHIDPLCRSARIRAWNLLNAIVYYLGFFLSYLLGYRKSLRQYGLWQKEFGVCEADKLDKLSLIEMLQGLLNPSRH